MEWEEIANVDFLLDAREGIVEVHDFNPRFVRLPVLIVPS